MALADEMLTIADEVTGRGLSLKYNMLERPGVGVPVARRDLGVYDTVAVLPAQRDRAGGCGMSPAPNAAGGDGLVADRIRRHAQRLTLTHLAEDAEDLAAFAETAQLGYLEYLDPVLEDEVGTREGRRSTTR